MTKLLSFVVATVLLSTQNFAQNATATITDSRDGTIYDIVKIADKVWMAQNLNYTTRNSWCFKNNADNCKKYGRIYSWFAIMNGQNKEKAQGICMAGWHVPTTDEWDQLISQYKKSKDLFVGGESNFNMLMAGCRFANNSFDFENKAATFWTSSSDSTDNKFAISFYGYADQKNVPIKSYETDKTYGLYLRCVKN